MRGQVAPSVGQQVIYVMQTAVAPEDHIQFLLGFDDSMCMMCIESYGPLRMQWFQLQDSV